MPQINHDVEVLLYRSYKVINKVLYVTILMTPPTMEVVTKTNNITMLLVLVTPHYD
jgi:hypothetical protein